MQRVGIFLDGRLMISYPNEVAAYAEILADLKTAVEATGIIHELKLIAEEEQ